MPTALAMHLAVAPATDVEHLLAADVRFSSPFADYTGRDRIAHLFGLMPQVLRDATIVRELHGPDGERATVLHGRIGDNEADAILDERYAPDGTVTEAMLLLRPYTAVREAMTRMGALL